MIAGLPAPATALDYSSLPLVYDETYVGETTYPTSPELDDAGMGGMDGWSSPGPPTEAPTLNGTAAQVSLAFGDPNTYEATAALAGALTQSSLALRGDFANLSAFEDHPAAKAFLSNVEADASGFVGTGSGLTCSDWSINGNFVQGLVVRSTGTFAKDFCDSANHVACCGPVPSPALAAVPSVLWFGRGLMAALMLSAAAGVLWFRGRPLLGSGERGVSKHS